MRVKISFEVEVPEIDATEADLIEWLRFELNDNGSMAGNNPYARAGCDVEPVFGTFDVN